jgi:alditol oxidase
LVLGFETPPARHRPTPALNAHKEEKMLENRRNWAGNYTYSAARLHYPETVEQVQELVIRHSKLKALGARHSFNTIADSAEDLISLEHFDQVVAIDPERRTVTVGAGIRYGQMCQQLHREGYALPNMASLPHISVAGACATATHGSGDSNGNLATTVSALELVTANGEVVTLSREQHGQQFQGAVVGLGGLGVVTKVTLDIVPTFDMRQVVYENLPWRNWKTTSTRSYRAPTVSVCSPIGAAHGSITSG